MKLNKFLEQYRIVERFEFIKENELIFENLNNDDKDLLNTIIDKSRVDVSREYETGTGVTYYDIYLDDKEIKSDLTYEQLEQFIESL